MSVFYLKTKPDGKEQGPFTGAQLKKLKVQGKLRAQHLISKDRGTWKPCSQVKGLGFTSHTKPPPQQAREFQPDSTPQKPPPRKREGYFASRNFPLAIVRLVLGASLAMLWLMLQPVILLASVYAEQRIGVFFMFLFLPGWPAYILLRPFIKHLLHIDDQSPGWQQTAFSGIACYLVLPIVILAFMVGTLDPGKIKTARNGPLVIRTAKAELFDKPEYRRSTGSLKGGTQVEVLG